MSLYRTSWVLLFLAFVCSNAGAQVDRVRQANELAAHGDHRAAVRVLREAQVEAPSARVDVNLAIALAELGHLREARRLLRRVAASDANPLIVEAAAEQLGQVEAQLPALTVHITGRADELRVDSEVAIPIDGDVVRLELDPGEHRVELRERDGAVIAGAGVQLARAERASIRLGRRPAAARPSEPRAGADEPRRSASNGAPSSREAAAIASASEGELDLTVTAEPARGDDPLPWILAGSGAAAAVIAAVVTVAVLASQPAATMGDVPPIMLGTP